MKVLLTGSICLTDLLKLIQDEGATHSAFSRGENNKAYIAIKQYVDLDTPDTYGNHGGVQLNPKKDKGFHKDNNPTGDKSHYIGNVRVQEQKQTNLTPDEIKNDMPDDDDLPF